MQIRSLLYNTVFLSLLCTSMLASAKNAQPSYGIYSVAKKDAKPLEDAYFADGRYFGLFDGYKGTFVAQYLANNLITQLKTGLETVVKTKEIRRAIARTFECIDNEMQRNPDTPAFCGAVGALVWIDDKDIYVAHIGSARVFVLGKNSRFWKSRNHEVRDPREMDRIRREQGLIRTASTKEYFLVDECSKGSCSIHKRASRSFGDFYRRKDGTLAKPRGLSVIPDIKKFHRKNVGAIIMVTDGVWRPYGDEDNKLGPLECLFREVLKSDLPPKQMAKTIVKQVRKKVAAKESKPDDMTVMVIRFA